jgi:hypothetical protein
MAKISDTAKDPIASEMSVDLANALQESIFSESDQTNDLVHACLVQIELRGRFSFAKRELQRPVLSENSNDISNDISRVRGV